MRDIVYIVGIIFGIVLSLNVGRAEGIKVGLATAAAESPAPINLEKQCVAWFFNADLKAAKKHMCGGKK
jgi:hypothetical protein